VNWYFLAYFFLPTFVSLLVQVLVIVVYVVFLSVVMANISCNLVMLQEHLEQLQNEVGERWHMGVYAMLIMFKQFRRAVTLMVVAKLMVCWNAFAMNWVLACLSRCMHKGRLWQMSIHGSYSFGKL
jgi:hypothetical protein